MNAIVEGRLAEGVSVVEKRLREAGDQLALAIEDGARLMADGVHAAAEAGISPGLIGEVLDFAGRMQADLGHAALMLQGVHASLHEALERLAPNDDANRSGGAGGKEPPPKP